MIPGIIAQEPFVPHTLDYLTRMHAFPNPLPEAFYDKLQKEYQAVNDVRLSRIVYDSDSLEVTGLFAEPQSISQGTHPLLIYNRGGSREFGMLTLYAAMRSMIPYARKGYLVAASNYRGNDGGQGHEEFGGKDVDDILNLIELAKQHPGFDGRNVYMIGHSRGAMMMYLAIRKGADLKAAAGLAGMADVLQTASDRPDIEDSVFRRLIPAAEADTKQAYINRSVMYWADEIGVPLQLHHGDADNRVDVKQSQLLAEKMHEAGKTCELHVYPGDNHALLRNWDSVVTHTLNWMERFRA